MSYTYFISPPPGQFFVLHDWEEVDDPLQARPPFCAPRWVLERVLVPEPHDFEHDDHDLHWFQVQSTENDFFNIWKRVHNVKQGCSKSNNNSFHDPPTYNWTTICVA